MSATTQTPEPMRKLVIWFFLLVVAIMAMQFFTGYSTKCTYPAESRYNEKVWR